MPSREYPLEKYRNIGIMAHIDAEIRLNAWQSTLRLEVSGALLTSLEK